MSTGETEKVSSLSLIVSSWIEVRKQEKNDKKRLDELFKKPAKSTEKCDVQDSSVGGTVNPDSSVGLTDGSDSSVGATVDSDSSVGATTVGSDSSVGASLSLIFFLIMDR